jgi:hypothetical protein
MSTAFDDKDDLREDILRRIHAGTEVTFNELASAMFPKEHIHAISRRHLAGLYSKQCGRDVSDLLQQNLLLLHAIRMTNEFIQQNKERLTEEPKPPATPPRPWWLFWQRGA